MLDIITLISLQSLDRLGRRGDLRDDSAEILYQSFVQEALVSSSGMGRDVHSLVLSFQHFLCPPQLRPPSKAPQKMALERLSWRVTCLNHASLRLPTTPFSSDPCGDDADADDQVDNEEEAGTDRGK